MSQEMPRKATKVLVNEGGRQGSCPREVAGRTTLVVIAVRRVAACIETKSILDGWSGCMDASEPVTSLIFGTVIYYATA